ncbi:unnamed protein product, partial [Brassica oleracea var. botrytis]
ESDLQRAFPLDPRWPYLGRWSASPNPVTPAIPLSMVKKSESAAPAATATTAAAGTVAAPLDNVTIIPSPATETTTPPSATETTASPPASATTDPPPPSGFLTNEPNVVSEGILPLVASVLDENSEKADTDAVSEKETDFVRSLGAWSKPFHFTPPHTPSEPATPRISVSEAVKSQIASFWPSIGEAIVNGHKLKKVQLSYPVQATSQLPVDKIPPPALKDDGSLRFPWAARMNQSSRNLFRAAEPTYRLDGTPQVTIPSRVLKLGPENNEEYIIGQFHRCSSPPGGLIHAVLNRLWGHESVNAAPSESQIMEEIPSPIIILEGSGASENEQPI